MIIIQKGNKSKIYYPFVIRAGFKPATF